MKQSQREIEAAEGRMIQAIHREQEKARREAEENRENVEKRVRDIQVYLNEVKEEQDRQGERIKISSSEMFQFQAGIIGNFKKLRGDVMIIGDDCSAIAQIVRSMLDYGHHMLTQIENNIAMVNMSAVMQGDNNTQGSLKVSAGS